MRHVCLPVLRLPRGDDGREGGHGRGLRCGLLVGEPLGCLTAAAVHRRGVESEEFAQRRVGGVHRLGERELASDDGLTDEGLGSLRRGLAGEELAQPVAADNFRAGPRLVVRDDESALLARCLGGRLLVLLAGLGLARAGEVGPALDESGGLGVAADPHGSEHLHRLRVGGVLVRVVAVVAVLGVLPLADHHDGSAGQVRPLVLGYWLAVGRADVVRQPESVDVAHLAGVEHG